MCNTNHAISIMQEVFRSCNDLLGGRLDSGYLYGSYARGDYDQDSDVDIFLTANMTNDELSSYNSAIAHVASKMSLEHDVTVSIIVDPASQFHRYQNALPYYRNIVNEGVLYKG